MIKKKQYINIVISVLVSVLLVSSIVWATSIGTNLNISGTASSTGSITVGAGNAADDDYLYFDGANSEYLMWDDAPGEFDLTDDLNITGYASTTVGLYSQGVLHIGGNTTLDGFLTVLQVTSLGASTFTTASTTSYLSIGGGANNDDDFLYFDTREENLTWDDSLTKFILSDDLQITGTASTTSFINVGGDDNSDNDILYFDTRMESLIWNNGTSLFDLSDDLSITGYATTSAGFNTQSNLHVGGNITFDGMTTSTNYIYLPMVHFEQGATTSTNPNQGECFMPNNDLKCWDGAAWQYAW